jgi:hypothetical protein
MIFTFKNLSYLRLHYTRNAQNPPKYGILIKFSRNLGCNKSFPFCHSGLDPESSFSLDSRLILLDAIACGNDRTCCDSCRCVYHSLSHPPKTTS